jgi:UDP:flavonoid glycosyltransferase YjiC (YdhE family)
MLDIFDRPARVFLAMSQAFDFKADWLPDNVRYVGPLLDQPSWSEPWRAPWSTGSNRPRALIACSTGAQGQGGLFQRVIHAMGQLDIEVVATAGPNLDIDMFHTPDNVHLLRSAPHDAVMSEVSLVISQGGHGTVNRALIHGLPLLVLPMGRDQGDNAARVEAKGAGLRLPPDASETEIASAAARLILDPQFSFCARRLGNAIKIDIDGTTLVREMEAVAAIGCDRRMAAASTARATSARRAGRPQPAA